MERDLSVEEQDALVLASLTHDAAQVAHKEQQNREIQALVAEKKQLVQRLESFLRAK